MNIEYCGGFNGMRVALVSFVLFRRWFRFFGKFHRLTDWWPAATCSGEATEQREREKERKREETTTPTKVNK